MALKSGKRFSIGKNFFWRLNLVISIAVIIAVAVLLWMSGEKETQDAFSNGRRLVMNLETGEIQGNQAVVAVPETKQLPPSVGEAKKGEQVAEESPDAPVTESIPSVPLAEINQDLMEKHDDGFLPKIGESGIKPWQYYAKPYERKGSLPMVAIIVTGLGQNKDVTDRAMNLPDTVGLSFSSYAKDVASWMTSARRNGHEVFIDMPVEPVDYPETDPGPYGLMTGQSAAGNEKKLQWVMTRGQGYVGMVMPYNDGFSSNNDGVKFLSQSLAHRGVMMVSSHEPAKADTKQIIDASNVAMVTADALLDEDLTPTSIQTRLIALEQQAKNRGYAVGIAQAYPLTIEQINVWASRLESRGFVLVPISFVTRLRFS